MSNYVIMSVYGNDGLGSLREAMDSVLSASGDCKLLLGVDGPVARNIEDHISIAAQVNSRLRIVRYATNRGLAPVLNDLIDVALQDPACEFVFRMDSDDLCHPDRFSKQADFLRAHPDISVAGSFAWLIDDDGVRYSEIRKSCSDQVLKQRLPFDSPFVHPSVVFRSDVFRAGFRYPTTTLRFEDVAMWSELALAGHVFGNLPDHLLLYRLSQATASRRAGFFKSLSELRVRASYTWRRMPWRADIFLLMGVVCLSKMALPPAALRKLFSLRATILHRFT